MKSFKDFKLKECDFIIIVILEIIYEIYNIFVKVFIIFL